MPATMAGSRGGVIGRSQERNGGEFIRNLLSGHIGVMELSQQFRAHSRPQTVTLVVNNACNLRCAHCYLQVKELTTSALKESEWKLLIDSIARMDLELLCLSGKEVFVGDMGARLLSYLREARDGNQASYRTGLITNGTLVHRHKDTILRADPSYFDISLDGLESDHDAVRGNGAFALALPNIEWAAKTFRGRFFVNLTVQKQNASRLVEAIDFLQQRGVENISCGFYRPLSYTAKNLTLTDQDVDLVFESLSALDRLSLEHPVSVLFDLDIVNLQPTKSFLRSRWFSLDRLRQAKNGEHYIEYRLKNGIRLEIRLAPYPTGIWRSVRITPEGNYLAAEDTIDTTMYAERSLGNAREFNYDFALLHARALASERFKELLADYCERILPELVEAYRCRDSLDLVA